MHPALAGGARIACGDRHAPILSSWEQQELAGRRERPPYAAMETAFYITALIAVISTLLAVSRVNAVHSLLYLILSFLSIALIFFILGAPFIAALEVIIYAGAIMVLFVFVVMLLNLGRAATERERQWLEPNAWWGPALIGAALLFELVSVIGNSPATAAAGAETGAKAVAISLFGPYLLGVELAAMLLLAGMVGAYHLGRREPNEEEREGSR
jgi:NADH-quinone oxidoreductase subunit J